MKNIILLDNKSLEQREDGWFIWNGILTEEVQHIEVSVPALHILGSVRTAGYFKASGKVIVEGSMAVSGSVECDNYLIVGGELISGGSVMVGDDLIVGSQVIVDEALEVKRKLRPGWHLSAQSVKAAVLYWPSMHMPDVDEDNMHLKFVWGYEVAREYWSERTGQKLKLDFDHIREQLAPEFTKLITREDLTKTERWIVKSHEKFVGQFMKKK